MSDFGLGDWWPQLTVDQAGTLEKPFTITEVHNARNLMPNNKSPGPDGFPAEFYKHFWNSLSPIFNRLTDEIKQKSKLPIGMNTATISLLLKPNNDPTSPLSYHHLSLIQHLYKND